MRKCTIKMVCLSSKAGWFISFPGIRQDGHEIKGKFVVKTFTSLTLYLLIIYIFGKNKGKNRAKHPFCPYPYQLG